MGIELISDKAEVCLLHWNIGKGIKEDVVYNQRAVIPNKLQRNEKRNSTLSIKRTTRTN